MDAKRRILIVVAVLLTAGLLITTGWSVADDIVPAPVVVPCGVYTGVMTSGPTQYPFTLSVIPLDPAGNTLISVLSADNMDPTYGEPGSEVDHHTDFTTSSVRTGPTTWAYTGVAYGTKTVEGQTKPEIVYIEVGYGTTTSTADGNVLTTEANSAFYYPEQDADGDGFPDPNQEPFYCAWPPGVFTATRIPVTPRCVPTPLPEGQ